MKSVSTRMRVQRPLKKKANYYLQSIYTISYQYKYFEGLGGLL